jgi:hypothetical protein
MVAGSGTGSKYNCVFREKIGFPVARGALLE